jgi:hypothetical protein
LVRRGRHKRGKHPHTYEQIPCNQTERGGFEPPMDESPIPVFETGAFNRSATSPGDKRHQK